MRFFTHVLADLKLCLLHMVTFSMDVLLPRKRTSDPALLAALSKLLEPAFTRFGMSALRACAHGSEPNIVTCPWR
jgi:hypothetical protein